MSEESTKMEVNPSSFDSKTYAQTFNDNYYGLSTLSRELKEALKKRDSGKKTVDYIPWAVMVRMATLQDPNFSFEKLRASDGTFLFYNGRADKDDACYFVKVQVSFMGKTLIEDYPIQDMTFDPVNFDGRSFTLASGKTKIIKMDGNIINKSLQRALAKAISEVTGLGLSLYEDGDLQFTEDPIVPEPAPKEKRPSKSKQVDTNGVVVPDDSQVGQPKETDTANMDAQIDESLNAAEHAPDKPLDDSALVSGELLQKLKELADDKELGLRVKKAMSAYKVSKLEDFTVAQANSIIQILSIPKKG